MRDYLKLIRLAVCFLAAVALLGCAGGSKIVLNKDNYKPGFRSGEFSRYRGKTVILDNFINQAANTRQWSYASADGKFTYEATDHLESYMWYCFKKAFDSTGIKVLDQTYGHPGPYYHPWWGPRPYQQPVAAPKGVTDFQLILKSMTDQEWVVQVLIFKNGETKLQKDYTITVPPTTSQDKAELEKRAYRTVDQLVTAVFRDREFQKAF
jgi:hypothetical protein